MEIKLHAVKVNPASHLGGKSNLYQLDVRVCGPRESYWEL